MKTILQSAGTGSFLKEVTRDFFVVIVEKTNGIIALIHSELEASL